MQYSLYESLKADKKDSKIHTFLSTPNYTQPSNKPDNLLTGCFIPNERQDTSFDTT